MRRPQTRTPSSDDDMRIKHSKQVAEERSPEGDAKALDVNNVEAMGREHAGGKSEQFEETAAETIRNNEDENEGEAVDEDEKDYAISEATALSIHQIQQKMELFTQQVSGLLEAGKNFFVEISNQFEERICMIHQEQMNKWQEDIRWIREMDAANENVHSRIHDAQFLLHSFGSWDDSVQDSQFGKIAHDATTF